MCPLPHRGFTLLEILVALAILAIAMAAIMRVASSETSHTDDMRLRLLADWVAQNRLALHSAQGSWLRTGEQSGKSQQGGVNFIWREKIINTPNPSFRRIEVSVYQADDEQYALRELTGFLVKYRRR